MSLAETYQKKTDREHILDAPDTYIGSISKDRILGWSINEDDTKMIQRECKIVPGLFKCFDEGIVNARDHYVRMKSGNESHLPVTQIQVSVEKESGQITIMNDGNGIDVEKHPTYDIWIPEMIFGHLRTSTNYKKDELRIVGGKNGFGFKLVLIYSTWGRIETVDHIRKLRYVQEFKDNLTVIGKPKITKLTKAKVKPYTKVSWIPDYKRFGLASGLSKDMELLFKKRTYDIAAVTEKDVKIKYNGTMVPVRSFEQYVNMYVGNKTETKRVYERSHERWEYAVCLSPFDEFTQVSFVNGISTSRGGKHVDYILQQITKKCMEYIEKKKKVKVKSSSIKEQLMLFVNCVIDNPSFDSQTKDALNTNVSKFGSSCKISDNFIEKVCKLGIVDQAISIHNIKENKAIKKTDGKKTKTLYGVPKLVDANFAGTAKSKDCMLILCEGDSAKAGIVSGLSKEDRNYIGIYPLKGKLLNVRDITKTRISDNKEISDIKKIMGLETNKVYKDRNDIHTNLRYGRIILLTDQDLDGVHIRGLCVNMFDSQWHQLVRDDSFLGFMNTPILKATKGKEKCAFYNEQEFEEWKEGRNMKGWNIKYYKGLGTSTGKEFKEYFQDKKIVQFRFEEGSKDALDKVFRKNRAEDRKTWLEAYDPNKCIEMKETSISYEDFVDKELIHFSKYDCERSIPNMMDGLKMSQRKILFSAFKRNLTKEIKVAQFGGYISEHSGYHHGENSLMQAIVGMAQDYVGSNNINLFTPNGQFGTRLQGGADSASERYIFTQLHEQTRKLFIPADEHVLKYLDDDGTAIEPEFYVPIIPMLLVNGAIGIGTGFSTNILSYHPKHIIQYIRKYLDTQPKSQEPLIPFYRGFKGTISQCVDKTDTIIIKGVYTLKKNILHVTELPIGLWTENYKQMLDKYITNKTYIKDYVDMSTDKVVDFKITLLKSDMKTEELEKVMNLVTTKKTNNMHVFDEKQQLKRFAKPEDIIDHFIPIRLGYYEKRKQALLDILGREVTLLKNKARFIQEQCDDVIDLRKKKKTEVIELLSSRGYDVIDNDMDYGYLCGMSIQSFMYEHMEKLLKQRDEKIKEMNILKERSIQEMWKQELVTLEESIEF